MSTHQVIYICRTSALNWQIYESEASYRFCCVPLCFVICSLTPTCKSCVCISHCTVHLQLYCTSPTVLYISHCTVPDELWIIYKLKLQYVTFENYFSSRKLGHEESRWIFSTTKSLLTAKFKLTTQINTEKEFCAEDLPSGLWLSIFGPVIRKAHDTFEKSGTTRALTLSHLRRLTFDNSAVRKSNLLCLYMLTHFRFETPLKAKARITETEYCRIRESLGGKCLLKVGHDRPYTGMLCVVSFGYVSRVLVTAWGVDSKLKELDTTFSFTLT